MKKKTKQTKRKITSQNNKKIVSTYLTVDHIEAVKIFNRIRPLIFKLIRKEIDLAFKRIFNSKILTNNKSITPNIIRIDMDDNLNSNLSHKEKDAISYIFQNNIDDDLSLPNDLLKDINLNEITQIFDGNAGKNTECLKEYLHNSEKSKKIDVKNISIEDFVNNLKKENLKKE